MKNLTILLAILLISTTSFGKNKKYTYTDTSFNSIEFTEITFTIDRKTLDTLEIEGLLKQQTFISGVPCIGKISFHGDWALKYCILFDEYTFGVHTFPKGTQIGINISRFELGSSYFVVSAGADTVNTCGFTSNQLINGLMCDGEEVIFTQDWKLRACILSDDDTIAGHLIEAGTLALFGASGNFSIYCPYDPIIQGYHCSGTSYKFWGGGGGISFHPNGSLRRFKPVDDVEIQGVLCKHKCIWLYPDGKLQRCTSAIDQTINGVSYKKGLTLKFDEEGKITESYKDKFF